MVELCRSERELVCATRTTGPDGAFAPVEGVAGGWLARVFPPAGDLDHEVLVQSLGAIPANSSPTVTLRLEPAGEEPPFIDPAGVVVDPFGNPIADASVHLWVGEGPSGPFTPVPSGAAIMSPANRSNPMLTDVAGSFAWDVVAGYYRVTATKHGCVTTFGGSTADSGVVRVPPPVLDIELVLDCRPPDDGAPLIGSRTVPVSTPTTPIPS